MDNNPRSPIVSSDPATQAVIDELTDKWRVRFDKFDNPQISLDKTELKRTIIALHSEDLLSEAEVTRLFSIFQLAAA